ncbi:MAG: FAD-dependent oxidoreductase [Candidatus Dependentiae bacterium]|nr:FAD-dependent oxidoreductase [Candidatus Dependentiae bacterium]
MEKERQVIIIGSGPAGLTAAIYLARLGIMPTLVEGPRPGGQLMSTSYIENWPGIQKIRGGELIAQLHEHAASVGTQFVAGVVTSISHERAGEGRSIFTVVTARSSYTARAIIIASGAHPRRLGCPGEDEYWGRGVSSCGICDGAFFKDLPVMVVGGGNTGLENAHVLRQYTDDVTIINHGAALTGNDLTLRRAVEGDVAIKQLFNSTVTAITGNGERVTGVTVANAKTGQAVEMPTSAVFVSIGQVPSSDFVKGLVEMTPRGTIILKRGTETSIAGIFAAGDVTDGAYQQAVTAAGTGCMAALDVQRYLTAS